MKKEYNPSDVLLDFVQLTNRDSSKEDWQKFADKLMQVIDNTHVLLVQIKKKEEFKELGNFLWDRIFSIEDLSREEIQRKRELDNDLDFKRESDKFIKSEYVKPTCKKCGSYTDHSLYKATDTGCEFCDWADKNLK